MYIIYIYIYIFGGWTIHKPSINPSPEGQEIVRAAQTGQVSKEIARVAEVSAPERTGGWNVAI